MTQTERERESDTEGERERETQREKKGRKLSNFTVGKPENCDSVNCLRKKKKGKQTNNNKKKNFAIALTASQSTVLTNINSLI